jgi:hypothetical protein
MVSEQRACDESVAIRGSYKYGVKRERRRNAALIRTPPKRPFLPHYDDLPLSLPCLSDPTELSSPSSSHFILARNSFAAGKHRACLSTLGLRHTCYVLRAAAHAVSPFLRHLSLRIRRLLLNVDDATRTRRILVHGNAQQTTPQVRRSRAWV